MSSSLLTDILWILGEVFGGEVRRCAKIPPLVAMIVVGIILGSHGIMVFTNELPCHKSTSG